MSSKNLYTTLHTRLHPYIILKITNPITCNATLKLRLQLISINKTFHYESNIYMYTKIYASFRDEALRCGFKFYVFWRQQVDGLLSVCLITSRKHILFDFLWTWIIYIHIILLYIYSKHKINFENEIFLDFCK